MKKNLKTVQNLSKILFIFFLFFISGCCHKLHIPSNYVKGAVYSGKIWIYVKLLNHNQIRTFSGYADFQAGKNFLYLRVKSPFNTTLGYIKWKSSHYNTLEVFDIFHKRHYVIKLPQKLKLKNFSFYFLGLKEGSLTEKLSKIFFKYHFEKDKKEGNIEIQINSDIFQIKWKIKSIYLSKNLLPMLKDEDFQKFSRIEIIF